MIALASGAPVLAFEGIWDAGPSRTRCDAVAERRCPEVGIPPFGRRSSGRSGGRRLTGQVQE